MDRKGLIDRVTQLLVAQNARKPVAARKSVIHISDDGGNSHDFIVRHPHTGLLYNKKDVTLFMNALIDVITQAVQDGEEISSYSFGTLAVKKRAARRTVHPTTHEPVTIGEKYVAKFTASGDLRRAAKLYGISLKEQEEAVRNAD